MWFTSITRPRLFSSSYRFLGRYKYSKFNVQNPSNLKYNSIKYQLFGTAVGSSLIIGIFAYYFVSDSKVASSVKKLNELSSPKYCNKESFKDALIELKNIIGNDPEQFSVSKAELDFHSDSYFNSHHATDEQRPQIILYPKTTIQVSEILKICHKFSIPIIPFSGGTSLEGHFLPTRVDNTIVIDLSKFMAQIIQLNKDDLNVTVQAGVPWEELNEFLNEHGLLFGCDPGPGAQIGGCIANSCSGTNAFRYGTMKENVVNITIVLADGTIIKTKRNSVKSSAGYNLNGLFIGSEGTLGIVTEATIKCHVKPKFETVAVVSFPTVGDAAACSSHLIQEGIRLDAMELLDDNMMKVINQSGSTSRSNWIESPTLFFKISGRSESLVKELIEEVKKISKTHNFYKFQFASNNEEKLELWEARKVALWSTINAAKQIDENVNIWTTDVAVPISKFSKIIEETKEEINSSGLMATLVGHAGDGNFHALITYNNKQRQIAEKLVNNMVKRAIDADGTCTGEHGIGMGKRKFLIDELGEDTVALMRQIKLSLDSKRILNPDKIFKIDPNDNGD